MGVSWGGRARVTDDWVHELHASLRAEARRAYAEAEAQIERARQMMEETALLRARIEAH